MEKAPQEGAEAKLPPGVRFLQALVIVLTLTMIGGVITVVAVVVTRFPQAAAPQPAPLPDAIALPEGATARAVTHGGDWYAVVTEEGEILVFDRATGDLRQRVEILAAP